MSRFYNLEALDIMGNLAFSQFFKEDTCTSKIDLGIEVNNNDYGVNITFPVVREAEKAVVADKTITKSITPILGMQSFIDAATLFVLGEESVALEEERAFGVQVLGGGGGMRTAVEFLVKGFSYKYIYVSDPSPPSHNIYLTHGGLEVREYRYWSRERRCLDLKGMLEDLQNAPPDTAAVFHASCHNPTGCDPTHEEWEAILDVVEATGIFPLFYLTFRGLGSGDLMEDAWPVRYAVSRGLCIIAVETFSKIMGLSSERVGNMVVVTNDSYTMELAKYKLTTYIRELYSNPPSYAALVIGRILNDEKLYQTWKANIESIYNHIVKMRQLLRDALEELDTPGDWQHITSQKGVFSLTGLNERQSFYLFRKYHIYVPRTGRISFCAVTEDNVKYIAEAINNSVTNLK